MTNGGMISLSPLYDFVDENTKKSLEAMTLFRSKLGGKYSKLCQKVTEPVDPTSGFYVWGYYDAHLYWHSTYVGKGGFRQRGTNLRKRILEELKDERGFVWRAAYDEEKIQKMANEIHNRNYQFKRPFLKAGSTRIMWFPALDLQNSDILQVESDLIEALNPRANLMRPAPANTCATNRREGTVAVSADDSREATFSSSKRSQNIVSAAQGGVEEPTRKRKTQPCTRNATLKRALYGSRLTRAMVSSQFA